MSAGTTSLIRHHITSVKRALAEMDYAQKRLLELRTGVPLLRPDERPARISKFDELEFLFAHDAERPAA